MKKITLILILLTSITVSAQNEKNNVNVDEVSTLSIEKKPVVNQDLKINFETIRLSNTKVIALVKHETFKSTSRRSRVKNITNFLKTSIKKQDSIIELC